jgi:hypothetical protein
MLRQEPHELGAGVSRGADDGGAAWCGHRSIMQRNCMIMQSARVLQPGGDAADGEAQQLVRRGALARVQ